MYKLIIDSLSTGVLVLGSDLSVRYMNTSVENLTSVSLKQAEGQHVSHLFRVTDAWQAEMAEVFASFSPYTRRKVDLELVTGRHITVDYTATPILEEDGSSCMLLELQTMDRLLRISREEALVSSQQTSRSVVRGLAHEIKNPLGGIRGSAQLLERELQSSELQDYTRVIIEESDRLRNLVDRMLGSNKPLQKEWLSVHEVLERVRSLVSAEAGDSIHFRRDYDPSIPDVMGDKEQLIQAVLNIVRNAMQALASSEVENKTITMQTRIQRHFTIGQQQHRLVCRIDIIDNGIGIEPELLKDIFYPMISGRAEGTGLGLAISQSIIVQHQGLIECESEPGETRFSIFIPLGSYDE